MAFVGSHSARVHYRVIKITLCFVKWCNYLCHFAELKAGVEQEQRRFSMHSKELFVINKNSNLA